MNTKKYFLIFIALCFCWTNCLAAGVSPEQENLNQKIKSMLRAGTKPTHWLRHPDLQKVFNKVSWNFNFFRILTSKQKELLKKDAAEIDKALDKSEIAKNGKTPSPSTIAQVSQTYLMIYALAMVAIVKEKMKHHYIADTSFDYADTSKKLGHAFEEILDSGEIISALTGAGATHLVLSKPLNFLQSVVKDQKLRPMFKNFMVYFANTLVSFTGWEFGAQLWKEATFLLDSQISDPEERKFLGDRNKIFSNIFRTLSLPLDSNSQQKRIAAKMLGLTINNLVKIVILDSNLRMQWLYNSLRLRMMNGNFVTLVTAMSSASTIGTALFPGAGTLLGLTFGFFGGVGTIFIPEESKNGITTWIKDSWKTTFDGTTGSASLYKLQGGFDERGVSKRVGSFTLESSIADRLNYREKYVDIYIERIFNDNAAINHANDNMITYYKALQANPNNANARAELAEQAEIGARRYASMTEALLELVSFYATESQLFEGFKKLSAPSSEENLNVQVVVAENMYSHFCSFSKSFLTLDFLDQYKRAIVTSSKVKQLLSLCKIESLTTKRTYNHMDDTEKQNFDSAIRFLDKTHWTKFDETALSVERISELLLLPQ